jgi:hypothetical protein
MSNTVYMNPPQLRSYYVKAPVEYAIWGRGTGKSSGLIAPRIVENVFDMPRSLGIMVADTYQSMLTKTLPGTLEGLDRLGYVRGRDYFFGEFAPRKLKWDRPYNCPLKAQYFMHWRNGSGMMLVSQDRPNSANGLNIDWIVGDEAKFLHRKRYEEELLPANRGHRERFGHLSNHHSILLTTDMPTSEKGMWLLDKKEDFLDRNNYERYLLILQLQQKLYEMKAKLPSYNAKSKLVLKSRMKKLIEELNMIRKGNPRNGVAPLIYYSEADSFENIHILGEEYFHLMRKTLSPAVFKTSILNKRLDEVPMGFYPNLSDRDHGYVMHNNSYLDSLGYDLEKASEQDSRMDSDILPDRPLDIGMDYGGSINCLVVGQVYGEKYRFVNSMYVLHPKKLRHLAADFKKYYQHHKDKTVRYYYDHTAKGTNAINDVKYFQDFADHLRKDDEYGSWAVQLHDIGATPTPDFRYKMWDRILKGDDPSLPIFEFNEKNAADWALSCKLTAMRTTSRNGFEKDKSKEKRPDYPQEQAPHLSDAGDTLIFGALKGKLTGKVDSPFISTFIG